MLVTGSATKKLCCFNHWLLCIQSWTNVTSERWPYYIPLIQQRVKTPEAVRMLHQTVETQLGDGLLSLMRGFPTIFQKLSKEHDIFHTRGVSSVTGHLWQCHDFEHPVSEECRTTYCKIRKQKLSNLLHSLTFFLLYVSKNNARCAILWSIVSSQKNLEFQRKRNWAWLLQVSHESQIIL